MSGTITSERVGAGALLTLRNAAKLNVLDTTMLGELDAHLDRAERDPDVRAVILSGEGEKAFCCGADIAEWGELGPEAFARFWVRDGHRVFDRLARFAKPTVAAVNGYAFGGGLELAACCDIRIAAPGAAFALPEARVGIVPGWGGTQRLSRLLPETVLKDMALFGARLSASRAHALGFVSEVPENALATATARLDALETLSPRANELAKAMIHVAVGEDRGAAAEALGSAAAALSADRREGVEAFLQKRPARFSGH